MLKGFAMITVIYCHNFPVINDYIYSFHMPLFFLLAGIFHKKSELENLKKNILERVRIIIIPYYLWGGILFVFWFFVGRHFGDSKEKNLSAIENFIGLICGQGGENYMDWGIPIWFLPCVFVTFLIYTIVDFLPNKKIKLLSVLALSILGYFISDFFDWYFWSFDVSLVAIFFYGFGQLLKERFIKFDIPLYVNLILSVVFLLGMNYTFKVDMYQSEYGGNLLLFYSNAICAILILISIFKRLPLLNFLIFIGRNTIVYLATQIRILTIIKAVLFFGIGMSVFHFTEAQKILITMIQAILIVPVVYFINSFFPILNARNKR